MVAVPDVTGLQKGAAVELLSTFGFTKVAFNAVRRGSKLNNHGSVQSQFPSPGTDYPTSNTVTIDVFEVPTQQVIKKVTVPLEKLPYMTSDGKYYLRYRVVSESGGSTSEWSPVSVLAGKKLEEIIKPPGGDAYLEIGISITSDDQSMFINWEIPPVIKNVTFDAHISWSLDGETWTDWQFATTTTANNFSAKIPEEYRTTDVLNPKYFRTFIQLPTKLKEISEYAKLVQSQPVSTRPSVSDGMYYTT
jgi:hypothetical protein